MSDPNIIAALRLMLGAAGISQADLAGVLEASSKGLLFREYADVWIRQREKLGLASYHDDVSRLNRHILPRLGEQFLQEIRPRHMREFVLGLRTDGALAPRTVHHVYNLASLIFKTAITDELIDANPCILPRGVLPKKADRDPEWRATAIYNRAEVETLISDVLILDDRRMLYALKALAGLRHTESASMQWRQYTEDTPLNRISLERTKTLVPRQIPVHPVLAEMLAWWWGEGWQSVYGRAPTKADLIVPTRNLTMRSAQEAPVQLHYDQRLVGMRERRGHDLRRTFITLAQVDGARRDLLETITHGPRGNIMNVYTSFPWPALCAEVVKLQIASPFEPTASEPRHGPHAAPSPDEDAEEFPPKVMKQ